MQKPKPQACRQAADCARKAVQMGEGAEGEGMKAMDMLLAQQGRILHSHIDF
jgi:hypothetical protein